MLSSSLNVGCTCIERATPGGGLYIPVYFATSENDHGNRKDCLWRDCLSWQRDLEFPFLDSRSAVVLFSDRQHQISILCDSRDSAENVPKSRNPGPNFSGSFKNNELRFSRKQICSETTKNKKPKFSLLKYLKNLTERSQALFVNSVI